MATKQREKRERRFTDARETAEQQDSSFGTTAIKPPEGVSFWTASRKEGQYPIDIIPYEITKGKETPGGNPAAEKGFCHYQRIYYVHYLPKADGRSTPYCCPAETFGKPHCPVCEKVAKLKNKIMELGGWDDRKNAAQINEVKKLLGAIKAKMRCFHNVIDVRDKKKGIQLYEVAFNKHFGEKLNDKIEASEKYRDFHHPIKGRTLLVTVKEVDGGDRSYNGVTNIEMEDRDEPYKMSIIEKAVDLDECLVYTSPKRLKELLEGGAPPDDEDEKKAKKVGKKKPVRDEDDEEEEAEDEDEEDDDDKEDEDEDEETEDEDEEDDDDKEDEEDDPTADDLGIEEGASVKHKKFGKCTVTKISGDGTSLTIRDGDDTTHKAVAPRDVTLLESEDEEDEDEEDEEDEEPAPKKKDKKAPAGKKTTGKKPAAKEEEDEDEETEDSDEEDDDWDDDEEEEESDEEEEKPKAKKKPVPKGKKK